MHPCLHTIKEIFENLRHPEGLMTGGQVIMHGPQLQIFNTGAIVSVKKLEITAESFVNQERVQETEKEVQQGFFGTRKYKIRVPQEETGMVLGLDIEITTEKDTKNQGGTIKATHNVKLVSKLGDIINTHELSEEVVQWDPGFWGKVLGKENSSKAATFVEGKIEAGNDIELLAEAGLAMNLASVIDAGNNTTIDGFLGVLTQNCAYKYLAEDSTKWTGFFTIKSVMREAANVGMARIMARQGDVKMASKKGKVTNIGTYVDAGGNIHYKGKKEMSLSPSRCKQNGVKAPSVLV